MTEHESPTDDAEYRTRTLRGVSHTHPYTNRTFGDTQTFDRGRTVAADGGERDSGPAAEAGDHDADSGERDDGPVAEAGDCDADEEPREGTLRDVDHTPPGDTEGAHRTYERGHEGKTDVR